LLPPFCFHVNHIYKIFIRCEIIGGSPTTSHEIQSVGFFGEDEIPELADSERACSDRSDVRALSTA
jgi:hypothetical protein